MTVKNGIDLINIMRESASTAYQDRIPVANAQNIAEIGNLLSSLEFEAQRTEFLGLLQKVALTLFVERAYNNPLKVLKKGRLPLGLTIEEIAIDIAKSKEFDPTGANNMARVVPNTINFYHAHELQRTYSASVSRFQLQTGFSSESNLNRMLELIINSLYNGYEVDEFLLMKEAYGEEVLNSKVVVCPKPTTTLEAEDFMEQLRTYVMALTYPSTEYNAVGITSWTPTERQVLLVDYRVLAKVSVRVLASAFNKSDVDFTTRIIAVDDFGSFNESLKKRTINNNQVKDLSTYAMLLDDEGALFYDQDMYMDKDHNGKGAFDTMHLHVRENFAVSHARNIVAFVGNDGIVELESENKEYWVVFETNARPLESGYTPMYVKNALVDDDETTFSEGIKLFKDGTQVQKIVASGGNNIVVEYTDGTSEKVAFTITNGIISATIPSYATKIIKKVRFQIA